MEVNTLHTRYLQDKSNLKENNFETLTELSEINALLIVLNICIGAEGPKYGENECDDDQEA
jgi:hypothetical protein